MYVKYCENKPKSEYIVSEYIDTFFEVRTVYCYVLYTVITLCFRTPFVFGHPLFFIEIINF